MADHTPGYIAGLATDLRTRHPSLLDTQEDDLALLRGRLALVTAFIHNPTYDTTARQALAHDLHLPGPQDQVIPS